LRCVGAPLRSERDEVVAAMSVSAPATRLSRKKAAAVALVLCKVADHVSGRLGWRGTDSRPPWVAAAPWSSEDAPRGATRLPARSEAG
jgi:hypothetical protein